MEQLQNKRGKGLLKWSRTLFMVLLWVSFSPMLAQQFKVMVYTSPDRWHDKSIPGALLQLEKMAVKHDFDLTWAQANGSGGVKDIFTDNYVGKIVVLSFYIHADMISLKNNEIVLKNSYAMVVVL